MFGVNTEFRVVTQHTENALWNVARRLFSFRIKITSLREADIVKDSDGSNQGSVYILCCKGTRAAYRKLMKKYSYDEMMYEGVKTLI